MLVSSVIILDAAGPVKVEWRAPVLWTTLALVAILLIGALVIAVVDRWRKRGSSTERLMAGDQLAHFRALYDRGELSREEFERIRALLGGRLRKDLNLPASESPEGIQTAEARRKVGPGPIAPPAVPHDGIRSVESDGPPRDNGQPPPEPPAPPATPDSRPPSS